MLCYNERKEEEEAMNRLYVLKSRLHTLLLNEYKAQRSFLTAWYKDTNWFRKFFLLEFYVTILLPNRIVFCCPFLSGVFISGLLVSSAIFNYTTYLVLCGCFFYVMVLSFAIAVAYHRSKVSFHFLNSLVYGEENFRVWFGTSLYKTTLKCLAGVAIGPIVLFILKFAQLCVAYLDIYLAERAADLLSQAIKKIRACNSELTYEQARDIAQGKRSK